MADTARMRRILFLAAIATVVYAVIVMVWPQHWRHDLIYLGGVWSLILLIFGEGRTYWRLSIPQIHEQAKQRRLRISLGETLLALAGFCLMIYGIGDYF
jgi:hypothetical protein